MAYVLPVLALVGLFLPWRGALADRERTSWWLALAVPGTAREYAPVGGFALAAYAFCGVVLSCHAVTPGATSDIDRLAMANIEAAFGVGVDLASTWRGSLVAWARVLIWVVPILSAAGMVILRSRTHDCWSDDLTRRWALARAGVFVVGGILTAALMTDPAFRISGAFLILAGIASGALALRGVRFAIAPP
jgi:hypothetical protein